MSLDTLVNGKDILLVGNSNRLTKEDYSAKIDSYEFVIRFNLALKHFHNFKTLGTKCDAWVFAMCRQWVIDSTWNEAKIRPKHCVRYAEKPMNIGENNYFLDMKIKDEIRKELDIPDFLHPTTGVTTMYYLLNHCNVKSLSIIGFDCFDTHNFYSTANRAHYAHELSKEKNFISKMIEEKRISVVDNRA